MWPKRNYLEDAKAHEEVFRGILNIAGKREKFAIEKLTMEELYSRYSEGNRLRKWTIIDFRVGPFDGLDTKLSENEALFAIENRDELPPPKSGVVSGYYSVAKYKIKKGIVKHDSNIAAEVYTPAF